MACVLYTLFTSMFGRLNDFQKESISLKNESEWVWIAKAGCWRHFGRSSIDFGTVSSISGPAWEPLGRSWERLWWFCCGVGQLWRLPRGFWGACCGLLGASWSAQVDFGVILETKM